MDARDVSLSVLLDMETNGTFSNIALTKALHKNQFSDKQERAFVTRLTEGTTEYRIRLDYVVDQFSKTKIKKCKPLIRCLLRMGTYQILFMDNVPDSAACNEMVKLAKKHGFSSLSGFVNGVLRNIARNKDAITYPDAKKEPILYASIYYSVPEWLVKKLFADYPKQANQILEGLFTTRQTSIRVNTTKISVTDLKQMLLEAGISVKDGNYLEKMLLVSDYDFVKKIPGYKQGLFTVQDESSAVAVSRAGIKPGDFVLDLCAAPGGKTTAALEYMENEGLLYSMDIAEDKMELIEENVERLGFDCANIFVHDATMPLSLERPADVVIADLPCSGLGIMGRKNDIKYRVTADDLMSLKELQQKILSVAAEYIKIDGTLLFSTCTINPGENEENTKWFLLNHENYELLEERLFLPGVDSCDGFYYAVLKRRK